MDPLKEAAEKLGEHYDSVLIIATTHEPELDGGTRIMCGYAGNYYAQVGSAREWLLQQDERTRAMFLPKKDS